MHQQFRTLVYFSLVFLITSCSPETPPPAKPTVTSTDAEAQEAATKPITDFFPDIGKTDFSIIEAKKVLPEDILQEVGYFGGGGEGPDFCGPISSPQVCDAPDDVSWPNEFCMLTQGWDGIEDITITTIFPDGRKIDEKAASWETFIQYEADGPLQNVAILQYCFVKPISEMQVGRYSFIFIGETGSVEKSLNVHFSTTPLVSFKGPPDNAFVLTGFSSEEIIRFFAYESQTPGKLTFVGWDKYLVDQNGRLIIDIPDADTNTLFSYLVVGEESGLVEPNTSIRLDKSIFRIDDSSTDSCNSMVSRLHIDSNGKVNFTDGTPIRIRAKPGLQETVVSKLPEGAKFKVLDGPKCVDNIYWWLIQTNAGTEGWMAEYQDGVYLLEPLP